MDVVEEIRSSVDVRINTLHNNIGLREAKKLLSEYGCPREYCAEFGALHQPDPLNKL